MGKAVVCNRCLMSTDIESVVIDENGECNFCKIHDRLERESAKFDFEKFVYRLKKKKVKYHCLIGISGGIDSSFMLEYAVKKLGLNPLVIHFQNWWNVPEAEHNMRAMVKALNVDYIQYSVNRQEYDDICKAFLLASVSDADIVNDMAMSYYMMKTADQYGIKWIFNGHDFRREGTSPLSWSYMDAKYIQSVYKRITGKEIKSYPLLTFGKQLYYALKGIRQIRPLYYINYEPTAEKARLFRLYGWLNYGEKHGENIYTRFVGCYLLPLKFGINKQITYLSARMRTEGMSREDANQIMRNTNMHCPIDPILKRLDFTISEWRNMFNSPIRHYTDFETYRPKFKKWRFAIYILTKLKVFPFTFYTKYCN